MKESIADHIERKAEVCGGRACIAGTRIRVQDVFGWHEKEGVSPDEIVSRFPQLTLADVHAALAYYWDHREEVERQMREDDLLVTDMKRQIPSKLARRLMARDNPDAAVPPG
jgi:uncharacterized protein (DUF433 family)